MNFKYLFTFKNFNIFENNVEHFDDTLSNKADVPNDIQIANNKTKMNSEEYNSFKNEMKNKVNRAKMLVQSMSPYLQVLISHLPLYISDVVKTAATDGTKVIFNPNFANEHSGSELAFVYVHELLHVALKHFDRQGDKNHTKWNYATDYAINLLITGLNYVSLPTNILYNEKFINLSAEEIYAIIPQPKNKKNKDANNGEGNENGEGDTGNENGENDKNNEGTEGDDATIGEVYTPKELNDKIKKAGKENEVPLTDKSIEKIKSDASNDINKGIKSVRAKTTNKKISHGSGLLERLIKAINQGKKVVNWKKLLKDKLTPSFKKSRLTRTRYNKRNLASGYITPGIKRSKESMELTVCMDTSGSIFSSIGSTKGTLLDQLVFDINEIFSSLNINNINLILFSTGVDSFSNIKSINDFDFNNIKTGSGNSDEEEIVKIINKKKLSKTPIIMLTDGQINLNFKWPYENTIWVIYTTESTKNIEETYFYIYNKDKIKGKIVLADLTK